MELEAAAAFLRERPPVLNSFMTEVWKTLMLLVLQKHAQASASPLGCCGLIRISQQEVR